MNTRRYDHLKKVVLDDLSERVKAVEKNISAHWLANHLQQEYAEKLLAELLIRFPLDAHEEEG